MDGPLSGATLKELMDTRATFISTHYPDATAQDYHNKLQPELDKLDHIPAGAEINLWFEDDLFCQVNMWWIINLLGFRPYNKIFLIRPEELSRYGFGAYNGEGLLNLYEQKAPLTQFDLWQQLWGSYQSGNLEKLKSMATSLEGAFPFVLAAVEAHEASLPSEAGEGRPRETLRRLMKELGNEDFGKVFKSFCEEEYIYGYGDLQVRRMWEDIVGRV